MSTNLSRLLLREAYEESEWLGFRNINKWIEKLRDISSRRSPDRLQVHRHRRVHRGRVPGRRLRPRQGLQDTLESRKHA